MTTLEVGRARVNELHHHGVLGMKWGHHLSERRAAVESSNRAKRPPQAVRVTDSIGPSSHKKTSVSAKGGEDHPAHADAIKAEQHRQVLKKSGAHALSNNDLRELNTRLQLEEQTKSLTTSRGRKFARRQFESQGQQHIQKGLGEASAQVFKKFATAGVA